MRDILDVFGDLPDFPGKKLPKNRPAANTVAVSGDPFAGVPFKELVVKGERRVFYTVGSVARILGRQAQTVRKWERNGWIPPASYRTTKSSGSGLHNPSQKGYRLYSREQVELLLHGLALFNLDGQRTKDWQNASNWVSFIDYIKASWPK